MTIEQAENDVRRIIERVALSLSREEYADFLDWLGSEAECREMALAEEEADDGE